MSDMIKKNIREVPEISVIIPAKNEAKYISRCLESLNSLNYPKDKYDIYVIDNGSDDNTPAISEKYGATVLSKPDGTIAGVRNFGALKTNSEIIAFLDADCVVPPDWFWNGIEILNSDNVSAVGFTVAPPDPKVSWVEKNWYLLGSSSKHKGTKEVKWLSSFNLLIKREYFLSVGGFNENLVTCEDSDIGLRLSAISSLIYSDKICIRHLGSVKTLKEFFFKELWRGKGNIKSYLENKRELSNLPSTFLPPCYLSVVVIFILMLLFCISKAYIPFILVVLIPMMMGIRKVRGGLKFESYLAIWVLCFTYLIARGLSVFGMRKLS